jgi:hypothetical protein
MTCDSWGTEADSEEPLAQLDNLDKQKRGPKALRTFQPCEYYVHLSSGQRSRRAAPSL